MYLSLLQCTDLQDLADLLTTLCFKYSRVLILGDLNIHVDQEACVMANYFLSMLDCYNLSKFFHFPTHSKGHTLDLIIANNDFVSNMSTADVGLSDHYIVFF